MEHSQVILIISIFLTFYVYSSDNFLVRDTSNGKVIGTKVFSTNGEIYGYAYRGIPYGAPPIGSLRFKAPVEPSDWDGIKDCTTLPKSCPIISNDNKDLFNLNDMSEDCLYLNVYASEECLLYGKCPVVLYIYGGRFVGGNVKKFNEQTLIENFANNNRNVIFINFNFRSGILGFMALNQKFELSMDTNTALHDALTVLNWIQKNIKSFGGDRNNVAVMGHSSGGVIASYLYASPRTRGLINKVILMSSVHRHVKFRDANEFYGRQTSIQAGCANYYTNWDSRDEIETTLNCLRNLSLVELTEYTREVEAACWWYMGPSSDYGPYSFMLYDWDKLSKLKPNIPILIGNSIHEKQNGKYLLNIDGTVNLEKLKLYCNTFNSFYHFKDQQMFIDECVNEYKSDNIRIIGISDEQEIFLSNILLARDAIKAGSNVFLYQFTYNKSGEAVHQKSYPLLPHHSTELSYIIGLGKNIFTHKDYKIQDYHSRMFTNFIKNSNPSDGEIIFDKYDLRRNNYYNVDFDDNGGIIGEMKDNFKYEAINFWLKKIPSKVGSYNQRTSEERLINFLPLQNEIIHQCMITNSTYLFNHFYSQSLRGSSIIDNNDNNILEQRIKVFCILLIPIIVIVVSIIIAIIIKIHKK
uniref:Carboxylic ester hydrolase n=1 Tax=Strongyloides venezuelensis TaxID=75913 RepID=A0A0K0EVZ9_STRVS